MFVKVEMRVLFEDITHADYYREKADKINIDLDSDEEMFENELMKKQKIALLRRAEELEREEIPSVEELYEFLTENDMCMSKARYEEMIDVCVLWHQTYNSKIYIKNDVVMISFVLETDPDSHCSSIEDIEELVNSDPFEKSRIGGKVGNYCKFPSRMNPNDLLGELDVDGIAFRVTDLSGKVKWVDEESNEDELEESDEETMEPELVEVDLDDIPYTKIQKKTGWSIMSLFKPRSILRRKRFK